MGAPGIVNGPQRDLPGLAGVPLQGDRLNGGQNWLKARCRAK
ncbi:hypothetical protein O0544_18485 [Edwardsiella anguillarum]|nr:hypothetical protein [Edwardsiella anguillarum]